MQISKETRSGCIDERRKLRELQEEERELKRRHREELAAPVANGAAKPEAPDSKGADSNGQAATGGAAGASAAKGEKAAGLPSMTARRRQIEAAEKAMAARVAKAKAACEEAVSRLETRLEQATRRNITRCGQHHPSAAVRICSVYAKSGAVQGWCFHESQYVCP